MRKCEHLKLNGELMQKLLINVILATGMGLLPSGYAQQPAAEKQVPNELIQYIRDARKAGINEKQIQQNAMNAGWPADMVSSAIDSVLHGKTTKSALPDAAETTTAKPDKEPAASVAAKALPEKSGDTPAGNAVRDSAKSSEPASDPAVTTPVKSNETISAPVTSAPPSAKTAEGSGTPKIPAAVDRGVPENYEIGAGDDLAISVWKEPDASVGGVVVRPDGKITLPILKDISVVGLTTIQAEKMITEQLSKFITAPDVTVMVRGINSKKIYLVGGVKREGPIAYTYRMTILQALSEAGGLTDYAKKKKIYVLRHENGRDYTYHFDYDAALRGEKMELNIPLVPGDTVVVPR